MPNNTLHFHPFSDASYRPDVHAASFRCLATNTAGSVISRLVTVKAGGYRLLTALASVITVTVEEDGDFTVLVTVFSYHGNAVRYFFCVKWELSKWQINHCEGGSIRMIISFIHLSLSLSWFMAWPLSVSGLPCDASLRVAMRSSIHHSSTYTVKYPSQGRNAFTIILFRI